MLFNFCTLPVKSIDIVEYIYILNDIKKKTGRKNT